MIEFRAHTIQRQTNLIDFKYSISVQEQLPVSDVDLTSILSNALENAINAVLPLETEKRHIMLNLRMDDGKLLISLKNTSAFSKTKIICVNSLFIITKAARAFGNFLCQFMYLKKPHFKRFVS